MSYMKPNLNGHMTATAVAIAKYKAVKLSGSNTIVIAGAGDDVFGFTRSAVAASGVAELAVAGGGAIATAAATFAAGTRLKSDANGDLIAATTAGDISIAKALESAVDNDEFSVFVETVRIHA